MRDPRRLLVPAALCGLLLLSCRKTTESSFPDLASARREATEAWLPAYLPQSATALRERQDARSGETLLAFTFDPADPFLTGAPCATVAEADVSPPPRLGRISWWPRTLLSDRRGGLRLFRCDATTRAGDDRPAWLALDVARGEAFLWRASR